MYDTEQVLNMLGMYVCPMCGGLVAGECDCIMVGMEVAETEDVI